MKKTYNQPQVQVTDIQSMTVMQAVSAPAPADALGIKIGTTTTQW